MLTMAIPNNAINHCDTTMGIPNNAFTHFDVTLAMISVISPIMTSQRASQAMLIDIVTPSLVMEHKSTRPFEKIMKSVENWM